MDHMMNRSRRLVLRDPRLVLLGTGCRSFDRFCDRHLWRGFVSLHVARSASFRDAYPDSLNCDAVILRSRIVGAPSAERILRFA